MTSWGTILGLSPNFGIWIRDDGRPFPYGMPDRDNDEIRGSAKVRDSSRKGKACYKKATGKVCAKRRMISILLKSKAFQCVSFSLDRGKIGCPPSSKDETLRIRGGLALLARPQ